MGRERYYKPGSFYRICDRTGFAVRSDYQQREWQGLIVDKRVWEARQPQDYVRGVNDDQTVPYARPRMANPPVGVPLASEFQVYGDLPSGVTFEIQNGSMMIFHPTSTVTQSSYPKGS